MFFEVTIPTHKSGLLYRDKNKKLVGHGGDFHSFTIVIPAAQYCIVYLNMGFSRRRAEARGRRGHWQQLASGGGGGPTHLHHQADHHWGDSDHHCRRGCGGGGEGRGRDRDREGGGEGGGRTGRRGGRGRGGRGWGRTELDPASTNGKVVWLSASWARGHFFLI